MKERPLWPQAPTPCPVASCSKERKYSSLRDFMDHWSEIHHKINTVYRCKKLFATVEHKLIPKQKSTRDNLCHLKLSQKPKSYIWIPFKIGSAPFRQKMRQHQRQLQSLQRRIDANKWKNTKPDISEEKKSFRLCRDECVVERKVFFLQGH